MIKSLSLMVFVLVCLEFQGVNSNWDWVKDRSGTLVTCGYGAKSWDKCWANYRGYCKYHPNTWWECLCGEGTEQYQFGGNCMTPKEIKAEKDMIEKYPTLNADNIKLKDKNTELTTENDDYKNKVSQLEANNIEQKNQISTYKREVTILENKEQLNKKEIKLLKEAKHWLQNYAPQPFQMEDEFRKNFNIALVGQTSSGKSSLNNTLRGLTPADRNNTNKKYAKVDDEQCTMETTKYQYFGSQCSQEVNLWDLPGVGTDEHERKRYLQDNGLRWYNLVIFIISGPWSDNDSIIVKDLIHNGVKFAIVRSKIETAIENDMHDNQLTEAQSIAGKKKVLMEKLNKAKQSLLDDKENHKDKKHNIVNYMPKNQEIFLLDCRSFKKEQFDFRRFEKYVLKEMKDYDHEQSINETALKYEQHQRELDRQNRQ